MLLDWYKIVLYHPKIANLNHGNTINMMMILTKNPFIFIDHHLCNKDKYKDEWVSGWVVELIFICGVWYGSRLSLLGIGIDKYKWIWDLQ